MITEVDEWYKDRAERVTFSDDIIKHTILANLPEVSEIIDISRRKKEKWERKPESVHIRARLTDGRIDCTHVFETINGMLRLLSRWDGSWGRTEKIKDLKYPKGKDIKLWPGYDMEPVLSLF